MGQQVKRQASGGRGRKKRSRPALGAAQQQELIDDHLRLVNTIAVKLKGKLPPTVELDDLVQAGRMGLMEAAKRFDPGQEVKFRTFAATHIRGRMLDELRECHYIGRVARRLQKRRLAIEQKLRVHGIEPKEADVRTALGWENGEYEKSFPPNLINESDWQWLERDDGRHARSTIDTELPSPGAEPPAVTDERWREIMRSLTLDEQTLMHCYYRHSATMKAIGEVLGLSESRISQLHAEIMQRFRAAGIETFIDRAF